MVSGANRFSLTSYSPSDAPVQSDVVHEKSGVKQRNWRVETVSYIL